MTVLAVEGGALAIHNPFILAEEDYISLEALGAVAFILVPNRFHASEAGAFHQRFPKAKVFASPAARMNLAKQECAVSGWLPVDWRSEIMPAFALAGTRALGEILFVHRPTKTLITTDLVFHMRHVHGRLPRPYSKQTIFLIA
jgi:hypothetical protein